MTTKLPPTILVLMSDNVVATAICNAFQKYWYNGIKANKCSDLSNLVIQNRPHMILVDDSHREDELQNLIDSARRSFDTPIPFVVVASSNNTYDNCKGLIDVVKRPFTSYELMAPIKKLLKASNPLLQTKIIEYADLRMDLSTYKVTRNAREIHLGPSEFKILQLFMSSPKVIFSRLEIIHYVWGKEHKIDLRTIDVHVNRIRTLIKSPTDNIPFIKTVRSSGYCLNLPGEATA